MIKQILLLILIFCLSFASCKKQMIKTNIEGYVSDKQTGQILPYLKVELTNDIDSDTIRTYCDETGYYNFKFYALRKAIYKLQAYSETACYLNNRHNEINIGSDNFIDIYLTAEGILQINLKNTAPFNNNDHIYISYLIQGETSYSCACAGDYCEYFYHSFSGADIDSTYTIKLSEGGNNNMLIYTHITKNDISTSKYDTLFLYSCDTTKYEITY